MDFLKSAVASALATGPPFPYTFGDRVDLDNSIWVLNNGTKKEDGSNCSILSFDVAANKSRLPIAKNALRKLRTLRHPGIVKVLETVETESYIYIAIERVTPLSWHVRRKALSEEAAKWGLYTVANTLRFINDEASSVHGNLRVSSIFTSESGEWKVAGLDILSNLKEDDAIIYNYGPSVPDIGRYSPPEVVRSGWSAIKSAPLPATDAYQYGLMIFEVFNGGQSGGDNVGQTKNVPPSMHATYKRLTNANPKARLSISNFLDQGKRNGGFFETPLIKLSEGVDSLGLKSDGERAEFLSELEELSDDFPEEFLKAKILPELLKSVEFGGGGPKVLKYALNLGTKLPDHEFESRLNPIILRLFASPDRQIRVCLLDSLPSIIEHFSTNVVGGKIWPQITTGFTDLAPLVREQTVKAVLVLVTKLSDRIINGELLKYLAKTSMDEQPGIRTNTTICIGKIARNLSGSTRSKVLINAFSKSLGDPFVHARNASLQALAATSDLFSDDDCASKILPRLCTTLVDKEKIIRDQANKTFDIFLARVRKHASTLPDTILPPPSQQGSGTTTPRMGTSTPANASADAGWTGWAISSFTNKLAAANGEIQPRANGLAAPNIPSRPSSVPAPGNGMPKPSAPTSNPRTTTSTLSPTPSQQSMPSFAAEVEQDEGFDASWGDMDDDGEGAAAFFDTPSASAAVTPAANFDDGGEPDFAGWLSAQKAAKSKPQLPKGLAKKMTPAARPTAARVTTTGSLGGGAGAKKVTATAQSAARTTPAVVKKEAVIDTKPKDEDGADDWGDAWD